jgi:hypothetical protein
MDKQAAKVIDDLDKALIAYQEEKETATQMEMAIENAIKFIQYNFEEDD